MEFVESSHQLRDKQVLNKIEKEQMLWNRFASDSVLSAQGGSTAQSNAPFNANVANNSENTTQSSENEPTFRTTEAKALLEICSTKKGKPYCKEFL